VSVPADERRRNRSKVFVLLAPLAALLGVFLAYRYSTVSDIDFSISKSDVVRIATAQAQAKGVKTDGWRQLVDLRPDNVLRHYLTTAATPAERAAMARIAAPVRFRSFLENPVRAEDSVKVTVSPDGRLLSYRVPPPARTAAATDAQARAAAEAELERRLGPHRAGFTFTSAGTQRREASPSEIRTFTFRRQYSPDLTAEASVDTAGANVIAFSVTPKVSPGYTKRHPELSLTLKIIRGTTIVVLILAGLIYVVMRFVRRLRENEIPLKRATIVAAFVFLAFAVSTHLNGITQRMDALEGGAGSQPSVSFVLVLVVAGFMAVLIGLTWGACEADLREAYPEKLTSTDALLAGRFSSRAVRSSLAAGLTIAAWSTLLSGLEPLLRGGRVWAAFAEGELAPYQYAYPSAGLLLFALVGVPVTMALLMTAVSASHRRGRTRNAQIALAAIVLVFFLFSTFGNYAPIWWGLITSSVATAILLVPFLAADVLAVIVSFAVSLWATGAAGMIAQPATAFRSGGWMLLAALVVFIGGGAIATFRRRADESEAEVQRPEYARNIAERILLTSEMDAARQAQLRVMPRIVPVVEGTKLAAKHSASAEIGSDYYEFFPSPAHVSVAVADARLPGLSSALCVSMLKGLLLNYAARITNPRDVADRVYRQLAAIFGDDLPVSFFFGRLERATGAFSFATFGAAPRAVVVRAGTATSLEGEEYAHLDDTDVVVIYTARLADLRNRDGASLGDEALHHELAAHAGDPQALVDAVYDLAARQSRGVDTPRSWAAVAMSLMTPKVQA
jgi:MFS family permease